MDCTMHTPRRTRVALLALVGSISALFACGPSANNAADAARADAPVPPLPTSVVDGGQVLPGADAAATTATLEEPSKLTIDEESEATVSLVTSGMTRFDVEGLPPGARFDYAKPRVVFRPDFTQSGAYDISVTGRAPRGVVKTVHVRIDVRDTFAPPAPVVVTTTPGTGYSRLLVRQTTDGFLDSPSRMGRTFDAIVVVPTAPTAASRAPVVVSLHGFGGAPNTSAASTTSFRIEPHDPNNTYWWGYGDGSVFPPTAGKVPPYTVRRVLHLVDWLKKTYPAADPERVFISGGSMGGAGALTIGLLHARHFAGVEATIAQVIPKNHRPSRVTQLAGLWGSRETNLGGVWDTMDLTRALRDEPEARDQFLFTKHGKDDPTIHFGAVVTESALTKKTYYATIEDEKIGHYAIWDEGAHGPADPLMGASWWDAGWSRISDPKARLVRSKPFPAFSASTVNDDPGNDKGNGTVPFSPESGYSAALATAGDTGWGGAIAGAFNRFLRWDTTGIVDEPNKLTIPLYVVTSPGEASPAAGYPTKRDLYTGSVPVTVDVTPRRTHAFRPMPGESVRFKYGNRTGTITPNADGSVTVPRVVVNAIPVSLELTREP